MEADYPRAGPNGSSRIGQSGRGSRDRKRGAITAVRVRGMVCAGRLHEINACDQFSDFLGITYLMFALVTTLAAWIPQLRAIFPDWLYNAFTPND